MATEKDDVPLFSFGVITDVQYADIDDRMDSTRRFMRHYRQSLTRLREAVDAWNSQPDSQLVHFVLQLGDLIDGANRKLNQSQLALDKTLEQMGMFNGAVHHTWGNHEFYNFSRKTLMTGPLNSAPACPTTGVKDKAYYAFSPHPDFLIVMLDTYNAGMLGYDEKDAQYIESKTFIESKNPNIELNDPAGLVGKERRFCEFNGAVDAEQLEWLDATLQEAEGRGQKVVVAGHLLLTSATPVGWDSVVWNYEDVLGVLHKYNCVLAYLCGHDHSGRVTHDSHGIHHLTFPGVVEAMPDQPDFGTVRVYSDRMVLIGSGRVPSLTLASW